MTTITVPLADALNALARLYPTDAATLNEAANSLREHATETRRRRYAEIDAPKWIKCADRYPSLGEYVWVSGGGGTCHVAKWCGHAWRFVTWEQRGVERYPFTPTHWQTLQLPPLPAE